MNQDQIRIGDRFGTIAFVEFDRLPPPSLVITNPSSTIGTGSGPGIGWHGPYLPPPLGSGAGSRLVDAWGRELLFFLDTANNQLLVLSRGTDGLFDFGNTDTLPEGAPDGTNDYQEPADPIEAVDVTTYAPNGTNGHNADNVVMVVRGGSWRPGWLTLPQLTVQGAISGTTKARFVSRVDATSGNLHSTLLVAGTDGSMVGSTWTVGPTLAALHHDGVTPAVACTGGRQLVVWQDSGTTVDAIDTGEPQAAITYNLYNHHGLEPRTTLILDTATFTAAP